MYEGAPNLIEKGSLKTEFLEKPLPEKELESEEYTSAKDAMDNAFARLSPRAQESVINIGYGANIEECIKEIQDYLNIETQKLTDVGREYFDAKLRLRELELAAQQASGELSILQSTDTKLVDAFESRNLNPELLAKETILEGIFTDKPVDMDKLKEISGVTVEIYEDVLVGLISDDSVLRGVMEFILEEGDSLGLTDRFYQNPEAQAFAKNYLLTDALKSGRIDISEGLLKKFALDISQEEFKVAASFYIKSVGSNPEKIASFKLGAENMGFDTSSFE